MDKGQFHIWAILIILGAVHGFFLSIVLWRKPENRRANRVFALLLASVSLHLVEYMLSITGIIFKVPHLMFSTYWTLYVLGPLYYWYVRALTNAEFRFRPSSILHLLPAIILVLLMLPFYLQSGEAKIKFFMSFAQDAFKVIPPEQYIVMYGQIFQILIYLFLSFKMIKNWEEKLLNSRSNGQLIKLSWLKKATGIFLGFILFYAAVVTILLLYDSYRIETDYLVLLFLALLIYAVGYVALMQPKIFDEPYKNGTRKSILETTAAKDIKLDIIIFFNNKEPYLQEDLKISDVAEALNIPVHHLSEVINQEFEVNFFDFVNNYRVEAAKKLLLDPKQQDLKILAVAFEAGFGNKATFNRVFKKYTGITPSDFRAQHFVS
ncbi:MAG: AraC family transcriptional regulator [Saprospiraceae bacterium]|nr:AraC family transcriptional regulator [Saprospiraceae bacterium]